MAATPGSREKELVLQLATARKEAAGARQKQLDALKEAAQVEKILSIAVRKQPALAELLQEGATPTNPRLTRIGAG